MSFTHLHVHSDYSLLDGFGTCKEYATKAKKLGVQCLSITDHGMMAHIPALVNACRDHGLKPVFGCELYVNDFHHLVPQYKELDDKTKENVRRNNHLVLYAKTEEGYRNLVRICSEAWINGFYYRPRASHKFIHEHRKGLWATSACRAGKVAIAVRDGNMELACKAALEYQAAFEGFALELMLFGDEVQRNLNKGLIQVHEKTGVPLVVTNDCHYCEPEDYEGQKIQLLLNSKGTINNPQGLVFESTQLWYKTEEEMDQIWEEQHKKDISRKYYELAKENTTLIAKECSNVRLDMSPKLPVLENADSVLTDLVVEGMKKRKLIKKAVYQERVKKELLLIFEKGYSSYFLIQKKIIDQAKKMGSLVGPGRGCFVLEQPINTPNGLVPIGELVPGTTVIDGDGNVSVAKQVFEYDVDEELLEIVAENGNTLTLTVDHAIFVVRNGKEIEIHADFIERTDKLIEVNCKKLANVKSTKRVHYKGKVRDLEVPSSNTYCASGFKVHNSAAGSLVCFLLGITEVDPIKHSLLFERFINPARGGKFMKLEFTKPPVN